MNIQKLIIAALTATILPTSLNAQQTFNEMMYSKEKTMFILNAPTAQKSSVTLRLYKQGQGGKAYKTLKMKKLGNECWEATVKGDLKGKFYTFDIGKGETPGTFAPKGTTRFHDNFKMRITLMKSLYYINKVFHIIILPGHQMTSTEIDPFQLRKPRREFLFDMS